MPWPICRRDSTLYELVTGGVSVCAFDKHVENALLPLCMLGLPLSPRCVSRPLPCPSDQLGQSLQDVRNARKCASSSLAKVWWGVLFTARRVACTARYILTFNRLFFHCVFSCKHGNPYAMLLIMPFCSDFVTITSTMYNNGDQLSSRTLVCIPPCLSILTANSIALYLSTEWFPSTPSIKSWVTFTGSQGLDSVICGKSGSSCHPWLQKDGSRRGWLVSRQECSLQLRNETNRVHQLLQSLVRTLSHPR